ncbi:triose-phosphate isomerase [Aquimarina sp. 2201CG5-10]|uniref:triose-phosphate isomerase n=1 Tax=Aquimarina callyspongiae TaxID=3098150 RepID=UPI002AB402F9|nr:triose-phosphate isomerase [Aquimarina sp. 2201CG5-10]MDY8134368.1 triose-phosphate isomerase [Aquimarina sp. 2201CG5-10]
MRKKIVAGNWKMNKNLEETGRLLSDLKTKKEQTSQAEIIVAPTFTSLQYASEALKGSGISVAAQNMHQSENGAFTGEISADMIKSVGVETVILGHSERRAYFGETDELLSEKVNTALKHNLTIIFCFGEELQDRKSENHFSIVESQLKNGLFHLNADAWDNIVLAYEPVWAIGTGETASPDQAQEMHAFIRTTIQNKYNDAIADEVSILYGGSVKPNNAEEIFAKPDVDGGLIGGASLDAESFLAIANAI